MKEIRNEEDLYKILKTYVLEISNAQNFITDYMEENLRHIAHKLWTDEIEKVKVTTYNGRGEVVKKG